MLLSAWTRAHWRKGIMPGGVPQRIIAAESSLARAMHLAPEQCVIRRALWQPSVGLEFHQPHDGQARTGGGARAGGAEW